MHKLLEEDRDRKMALWQAVQKQPEGKKQADGKIQPKDEAPKQEAPKQKGPKQEAPKAKESHILYPKSALFKDWGKNLSEDEQKEAQRLFEEYGYNVFLSDRLPLDRDLPDTRDPR